MVESLKNLKIGSPFYLRNLRIYPLEGEIGSDGFETLDEALARRDAEFRDVLGVNSVILDYRGGSPLFIMDGEEILGARQDRIINTAILAEPNVSIEVPVSCIEQGRWEGGSEFRPSHFAVTPTLRSILASTVTDSLKKGGKFESDQRLIWKTIKDTLTSTRVPSATQSFHDIYTTMSDEVEDYLMDYEGLEGVSGFMAYINDEFIGLDIFATQSLYKKLENKLLKSYALESLIRRRIKKKGFTIKPEELLNSLSSLKYDSFKSVGRGIELRHKSNNLVVRALVDEDNPIHIAAFSL